MNFFKTTLSVVAAFAIGAGAVQAQDSTSIYGLISNSSISDDFSTLKLAVDTAGLASTLSDTSEGVEFTVFAPSNGAFSVSIPQQDTLDKLLGDSATLASILTYHVVPGTVLAADLTDSMMVTTVNGESLLITIDDSVDPAVVRADSATVQQADIIASNGVIHKINAVLMPSMDTTGGNPDTPSTIKPLLAQELNVRIYPNPTTDVATIDAPSDVQISSIEVLNQAGQVVVKQTDATRVDLSAQPVGTYYLFIETNKGLISQTLQRSGQ